MGPSMAIRAMRCRERRLSGQGIRAIPCLRILKRSLDEASMPDLLPRPLRWWLLVLPFALWG
ncbi:MAG: hypothetical protein ACKOCM_01275, partial [Cyanobacteriota bacterium]